MTVQRIAGSKAFLAGLEGEFFDTEHLHYNKWKILAEQHNIVSDGIEFLNLWQTELVGIGDKTIYAVLAGIYKEKTGKDFMSWEECQVPINEYYKSHQHEGKVLEGAKEFVEEARKAGKSIVIVTHGAEDLVKIQLAFLALNGIDLSAVPVVHGDKDTNLRKENDGYLRAFELLKQKMPDLKPEQVTVLDDSPKYILRAQALGMNTAHISKDLADHLRQHTVADTVSWKDTMKNLVVVASAGLVGLAKAGAHLIQTLRL